MAPYLFFEGRTEEALEFYRRALGAEVETMLRYKDGPEAAQCPDGSTPPADKVMHACFKVGDSLVMASDGLCNGRPCFMGFSLSYPARSPADARKRFDALSTGTCRSARPSSPSPSAWSPTSSAWPGWSSPGRRRFPNEVPAAGLRRGGKDAAG